MAYLKNKYLANVKKWNIDLSKMKDGVYDGSISVPNDIKEFKGFKELIGFEIKEIKGSLSFYGCGYLTSVSNLPETIGMVLNFEDCISLTSVSNLPGKIGDWLSFYRCISLTSVSNLLEWVGGFLSFHECTSLTSISNLPSVVKYDIYTDGCPFFEGMDEAQIREKYGILKE